MKDFTMDPTGYITLGSKPLCSSSSRDNKGRILTLLFVLFLFLLMPCGNLIAQKNTAENIRGTAPVITPPGGFEIDGNAYADLPIQSGDWESDLPNEAAGIFLSSLTPEDFDNGLPQFLFDEQYRDMSFFYRDGITNNDTTIFTSSNKIDDNPTTYTWGSGSSPNKNEIQTAVVHFTYGDPDHPNGGTTSSDDLWVVFAADRQVTNGSSYIDFEFLQNSMTMTGLGTGSGGFASDGPDNGRTLGDLLVTVEFTIGGAAAKVVVREWVNEGGEYFYKEFAEYGPNTIYGTVNTENTQVPWSVYFTDPVEGGLYEYEVNQWAEGAVNLSYYFGNDPCVNISTLFVRTRTSGSSGTSELKDFPKLEQLSINLTPDISFNDPEPVCEPATVDLTSIEVSGCEDGTLSYWMDAEATEAVADETAVGAGTYYIKCTSNVNPVCFDIQPVTVIVNPNPEPLVDDQAECEGDTATFSTADLGEGYSYQWYLNDEMIEGATSNSYTTQGLTIEEDGDVYKVRVTNDETSCYGEDPGTLTVNENPVPVVDDQAECEGDTATFSTADLGAGFSYQWYLNDEMIEGATNFSYTTDALTLEADGDVYKVVVTNDATECFGEDSGTLTVNENPVPVVDDQVECEGDIATFNTPDLGEGFSYQWYLNDQMIEGATSYNYSTDALTLEEDGDVYKVVVTNDATECYGEDSGTLTVNENPAPVVDDQGECEGNTATFSTADLGEGFSYQWYLNDVMIEGASSYAYTTDALTLAEDGDVYKVVVTNDATECFGEDSGTLTVFENPAPIVNDEAECEGDTATFSTSDFGVGFSYQWYLNDVMIEGATSSSYTTDALTLEEDGDVYKVVVSDDSSECFGEDSGTLTVYPNPEPMVADQAECEGDMATFSTADLGEGFSYKWYLNDVMIEGATSYAYTTDALTLSEDGDVYKVVVTEDATGCYGEDSGMLTVNPNPVPVVDDQAECEGDMATFSTADLGEGFSYQWYLNDVMIDGATSYAYTTDALTLSEDGDVYKVVVTEDATGCYGEDLGMLTVNPNPVPVVDNQAECEGDMATFSTADLGGGYSYQWYLDDVMIEGATSYSYTTSALTLSEDGGVYKVVVTNDATECYGEDSGTLMVYADPNCVASNSGPICMGDDVMLYETGGDGESWLWSSNGSATFNDPTLQNPTASGAVDGEIFTVTVTSADGCTSTCTTTVTVEVCLEEGCTLGYWKNHTDQWACYETCTEYGSIFMNAPSDLYGMSLLDVLNIKGGGVNNLARQSVAALLNACSSDVQYYYSTGEVIEYVNAAFLLSDYEIDQAGNQLDMYNQAGCPLGGTSATSEPSPGCDTNGDASMEASQDAAEGFTVSPVPFKDELNVKYKFDYDSDVHIQIFDMRGNLVKAHSQSKVRSGDVINIQADFVNGEQMYLLTITTEKGTFTKNIVSRGK